MFACSCNEKSTYEKFENSFPLKQKLSSQLIEHSNDFFGNPTNLRIADSLFFVLDPDSQNFIKVFNLNNLSSVNSICKKGRGPGEYGMICRFELLESQKICFYDDMNTTYYEALLKQNSDETKVSLKKSLNVENGRIINTVRLNDHFVSTGLFKERGRLLISGLDSLNRYKYDDDYPIDDHPKMSSMMKGMAYQTHFTKSVNNHFVGYSLTSGELLFYHREEGEVVKDREYQLFEPDYSPDSSMGIAVIFSQDSYTGFLDVVNKGNFVYALYSGRSQREFGMEAYVGNKIFVFTNTGKPVAYYELDVDIRTFDVDESGTIYALSINPVPQLVKFPTK